MFIPLSTDAPVYHWPFATVGLIAANIFAFIAVVTQSNPEMVMEVWILKHGVGIHPIEWVLSMFMHAGIMHLIGNMLFLWIFGLVVEGKVGWWRFLVIYLGIGITQSAFEQVVMLGADSPGSLGASSAIYGIMVVALLWAPKNEIHCFYWFGFIFMGTADISFVFFTLFYLAFDVLDMVLMGMSSGWLHVTGAMVGLPVGLFMLQTKWVDCEGFDVISLYRKSTKPIKEELPEEEREQSNARWGEVQQREGQARIAQFIAEGGFIPADKLYKKMAKTSPGFLLEKADLAKLIHGLQSQKAWLIAAPRMAEWVHRFPENADGVRLQLSQICVTECQRPTLALELLGEIDFTKQVPEKITLAKKIARRARAIKEEAEYELENDSWSE